MRPILLTLLCLGACGGRFELATSADSDGGTTDDGGTAPDAGSDTSTPPSGVEGSYDLTFANVAVFPPGQPVSPSAGHAFRVDLKRDPTDVYVAVVTPRWGERARYAVDVQPAAIRLSGKGGFGDGTTTDTWETFTLARDTSGAIATFSATGSEMTTNGDVVFNGTLTGKGRAAKDATAPELRIDATSPAGPDGQLLPWDAIVVRAAEPITVARPSDVEVAGSDGDLPLAWDHGAPDPGLDWAGVVALSARRTSWTAKGADAKIGAPAQLGRDLVGLGTAGVGQPLPFLDLPPPSKIHTFDGDTVTVGLWGSAKLLGADPVCENGGCVKLEFPAGYCNVPRVGVAARLDASGATTVKMRYRVLANALPGTNGPPSYLPPAFTIDVAPLGGAAQHDVQNVDAKALKALGAPVAGYAYGTDWTSAGAPIPAGTAEAGVAIFGGTGPLGSICGLVPQPVPIAVVVDVVNAQ